METPDLSPLLDQLDDNIDYLEEALSPLLQAPFFDAAVKLPLLDKAQFYVLVTYAIESTLFSYLRLDGVNAKEHPVFRELARVKQYFTKITNAEAVGTKRENLGLDKSAAGRFIKHALAGNDKFDLNQAGQQAKQKARSHIRFDQGTKKRKTDEGQINGIQSNALLPKSSDSSDSSNLSTPTSPRQNANQVSANQSSQVEPDVLAAEIEETEDMPAKSLGDSGEILQLSTKKRRKLRKQGFQEPGVAYAEESIIPSKSDQSSHTNSSTFQALLKGPIPIQEDRRNQKHKTRHAKNTSKAGTE